MPQEEEDQKNYRPVIGITVGDPAGIGPEIVLKALGDPQIYLIARPVLIGDISNLEWTAKRIGTECRLREHSPGDGSEDGAIDVVDLRSLKEPVQFGVESEATGRSAARNIEHAVKLWKEGAIDAISTAPISKNALKMAGYEFPGHTEFLAHLTSTERFAMSFFAEKLRVVLLSTHVSLLDAIGLVTRDKLADLIRFSEMELKRLIGRKPRIAVAGLNPHASEGGMFGGEESREIEPAVEVCRSEGTDVSGPYSPDTIFLRGFRGEFDLVVACYHDQATIAVKSLSFGSSVNVTLGLPLVRTSVDHGTAFDIAGKGIADESSMKAAIKLAAELAPRPAA